MRRGNPTRRGKEGKGLSAAFLFLALFTCPSLALGQATPTVTDPHVVRTGTPKKKPAPKKKKKTPKGKTPPKPAEPEPNLPKEVPAPAQDETPEVLVAPPKPPQAPESKFTPKESDAVQEDVVAKALRGQRGLWLGARYSLTILPPFLSGLAVRGAPTLLFHSVGAELEIERKSYSVLFALSYTGLGFAPMVAGEPSPDLPKGASDVGYLAVVDSRLHAVSASADFLFSISKSKTFSFDAGAGIGAGLVFGSLINNWVHEDPAGPYSFDGRNFAPCKTVLDGPGCRPQDHASPLPTKIYSGGSPYQEKSWLDGGKKPLILPYLVFPEFALRTKLGESVAVRLTGGASLTGFFVRLAGSFRLGE